MVDSTSGPDKPAHTKFRLRTSILSWHLAALDVSILIDLLSTEAERSASYAWDIFQAGDQVSPCHRTSEMRVPSVEVFLKSPCVCGVGNGKNHRACYAPPSSAGRTPRPAQCAMVGIAQAGNTPKYMMYLKLKDNYHHASCVSYNR